MLSFTLAGKQTVFPSMDVKEMASMGGVARAKKLSAERRKEIASMGGQAFRQAREKEAKEHQRKKKGKKNI